MFSGHLRKYQAPGVQTCHASGVISSRRLIMEKKSSSLKLWGPLLYIKYIAMFSGPYIYPANQNPRAQTGHAPRGHSFIYTI